MNDITSLQKEIKENLYGLDELKGEKIAAILNSIYKRIIDETLTSLWLTKGDENC